MLKPNINLLRDHGVSRNRFINLKKRLRISYNNSFCMKFSRNHKNLYYIASPHVYTSEHKTFKLIQDIIEKVDLVIIEGIAYHKGISPVLTGNFSGEMGYALKLSNENKIAFSGIEPTNEYIEKQLIKSGVKKNDIILFVILQEYKVFYRSNKTETEFIEHINNKVIPQKKFDFRKYFEKRIHGKFVYGKTDLEIASPDKNGKYITNIISARYSMNRDLGIIENLYQYLNIYENIVIIYGQNHYYSHLKILENTFGKPVRKIC